MKVRQSPLRAAVCVGLLALVGCVYDHRFTQAIMERRRQAAEAEGARIGAGSAAQPVRYTGKIRFYVAADYRRQHTVWKEPLRDLVDAASSVLGPAFGIRLEDAAVVPWDPRCDRTQLAPCLDELAQLDAGQDGAWVIGVLGDVPRYTTSFEQLGLAEMLGTHFVMRDVADLAERDAIDRAFPTHSPSRRTEIYHRRKQHKRLAVFLHEWAHTLGGLHTAARSDLLHPSYDDDMAHFGEANAGLIGAALEDRFAPQPDGSALAEYVARIDASSFVSHEHARLRALIERRTSERVAASNAVPGDAPTSRPSAASGAGDDELALLTPDDRSAYRAAEQASAAGDADAAWVRVAPLIARYPDCAPVQALACASALRVGEVRGTQSACTRVQQLATTQK